MRVALVFVPAGNPRRLCAISEAMSRVLESKGHRVEILESRSDSARLAGFDFIMIGSEPVGLGKLPPRVGGFLKQGSALSGKRCFAFVRASGFLATKALSRLMAAMEGEGMRVVYSEILRNVEDAKAAAAAVPVERA